MPDQPKKFYLTTPIYYVNARPHIGHAYSTIVADVLARRHRLLGEDVYFLTGTDEHGQKIERSAAAAGIPTQQYADQVSKTFSDLWHRMGITHNQFIRTTDPKHIQGVQKLFADLYAKGQIYLSSYTGQYSVGEEMFVEGPPGTIGPDGKPTETVTEENFFFRLSDYQLPLLNLIESNELIITPESSRNEVLAFLRGNVSSTLSPLPNSVISTEAQRSGETPVSEAATLAHTAAGNTYVPGALRDLSVSRSSFTWGIPVPEPAASETKRKHVIYVWLDALANYMTALGYSSPDDSLWQKFWPADVHLVGKEITRFHCVYWPAFLLAAGLPLPKQVTANGWLLFDNSKMSKSKGNVVRTETILDAFGTLCPVPPTHSEEGESKDNQSEDGKDLVPQGESKDNQSEDGKSEDGENLVPQGFSLGSHSSEREGGALAPEAQPSKADRDLFAADILRYYLLREIPFGQDGSFSFDSLITRYNADLANGYGNLVSRVLNMIEKYSGGEVPTLGERISMTRHVCSLNMDDVFTHVWQGVRAGRLSEMLSVADGNGEPSQIKQRDALLGEVFSEFISSRRFARAIELITDSIRASDLDISRMKPWVLAKDSSQEAQDTLASTLAWHAASLREVTALLYPILPYATARVWAQLGLGDIEQAAREGKLTNLQWGGLQPGTRLGPLSPIFPRADKGLAQIMIDNEEKLTSHISHLKSESTTHERPEAPLKSASTPAPAAPIPTDTTHPAAGPRTGALTDPSGTLPVAGSTATTTNNGPTPSHTEAQPSGIFANQPTTSNQEPTTPTITIDDFIKIELRVAQIVLAERIPKADKLLRLEVDLGELGRRQILSGIAEWYTPEDLVNRKIVVITNLAPRKMRGLDSHGMLLAASEEGGKPVLATFGEDIPNGTRLK
jgi:methionyl-tRNA synthetase